LIALDNYTQADWFARLGLPLLSCELTACRAYLESLGYSNATRIERVAEWQRAEAIVRDPSWDSGWWQRESEERDRLSNELRVRFGPVAALERLSAATELASETIHAAAALAAARDAMNDEALLRVACGAATMTLHESVLARLAGCDCEHLFMRKYRLFAGGRWPLGVLSGTFHLF
jgi:hypothetical protein